MTDLGITGWPPAAIKANRLLLRQSEPRDRAAFVELFASPEVGAYTGGSQPRDELERAMPELPGHRPGCFVIDLAGAMIGFVTFDRRDGEIPGPVRAAGGEVEFGYLFLPDAWGRGYAAEASAAALEWLARDHPERPRANRHTPMPFSRPRGTRTPTTVTLDKITKDPG